MTAAAIVVAVLTLLPVVVLAGRFGLRSPVAVLVTAYAAIVPFGSAIDLPIPLPAPFDTLSSVAGVAAIGGMAAHVALTRRSAPGLHAPMAWWLLFLGISACTYAWSIAPRTTVRELLLLASGIVLYLLAAVMPVTRRELERIGIGIVAGATVASLLALAMLITGRTPIGESGTPRFVITGDDPNHTAAGLLLPLVLAVVRGLDRHRAGVDRVASLGAAALMTLGIVLTGSRGGLISAVVALLVVGLHGARPGRVAAVGAAIVMFGLVALAAAPPEVETRLTSTSSTGRTTIWRLGVDACADHCALGSGWGTFPQVYQREFVTNPIAGGFRDEGYRAHNIWLQAIVETGVAGFVALVAAYGLVVREARRLGHAGDRITALAALTGLAVASSLVSNLIFKYFWLVPTYVALAASVSRRERRAAGQVSRAGTLEYQQPRVR